MVAFLILNSKIEYNLEYYVVSVDSIEALTGYNIFQEMDSVTQEVLKSSTDIKDLTFD